MSDRLTCQRRAANLLVIMMIAFCILLLLLSFRNLNEKHQANATSLSPVADGVGSHNGGPAAPVVSKVFVR
ncbi:hypothetical protein [Kiloniella sp. EL199]|uniref:hypothetical protein n=1 Tax=Kiloniella sp. EL199 TaxID=2107581 RepID=UPI000EA40208|nr:hypothetical protein [Kiloniella sp. EL199]